MAHSGHSTRTDESPLLGVKPTDANGPLCPLMTQKRTLPDLGSLELDNNNNSMFLGLWNKMRLWPHLMLSVRKAVFEFSAC